MIVVQILRMKRKLSKSALARLAGLNPTTYGWIEARRFLPSADQLRRLACALDVREEDAPGLLGELPTIFDPAAAQGVGGNVEVGGVTSPAAKSEELQFATESEGSSLAQDVEAGTDDAEAEDESS